MIKIIIIALFAGALVMFAMRFFPALRSQIQPLLQNPLVRAILFYDGWRSISYLKHYQITETGFASHSTNFFQRK